MPWTLRLCHLLVIKAGAGVAICFSWLSVNAVSWLVSSTHRLDCPLVLWFGVLLVQRNKIFLKNHISGILVQC